MHHFTVAHVQRDKGGTPYSEDRYCASQQGERNPISPVLWSQASCAWSAEKLHWYSTGTAYLCIQQTCHGSEFKLLIARAVCARHAEDGVVVPTNSHMNVFTAHAVDNLDGSAKGDKGFHG